MIIQKIYQPYVIWVPISRDIPIEENIRSLEKMLPYVKMVHVAYNDEKYGKMSLDEGEGIRLWASLVRLLKEYDSEASLLFEFLKDSSLEGLKHESNIMRHIFEEFMVC